MSVLGAIGAAVGIAGTVVGAVQGIASSRRSRRESDRSYDLAREQFRKSKYQDERNFQYQKLSNQLTRDREDNSMQRKVADMKAAGLHPTLAVGGGAGAQAMGPGGQAPAGSAPMPSREMGIMEQAKFGMMIKQMQAENRYINAQVGNVKAQTANVNAQTDDIKGRGVEGAESHYYEMRRLRHNITILERSGLHENAKSGIAASLMQVVELLSSGRLQQGLRDAVSESMSQLRAVIPYQQFQEAVSQAIEAIEELIPDQVLESLDGAAEEAGRLKEDYGPNWHRRTSPLDRIFRRNR